MMIVALSDIHGAYRVAEEILRSESSAECAVIAGDLTTRGTHAEASEALRSLASVGIPLLIVAGNMDPPELHEAFPEFATLIDGTAYRLHEVAFFGVSGSSPTPMNTPFERSEAEIERLSEAGWKLAEGAKFAVYVPHSPPKDTPADKLLFGKHAGSAAVRNFIVRRKPHLCICGHIHEARGISNLGSTLVINCGPAHRGYYARITMSDTVKAELAG